MNQFNKKNIIIKNDSDEESDNESTSYKSSDSDDSSQSSEYSLEKNIDESKKKQEKSKEIEAQEEAEKPLAKTKKNVDEEDSDEEDEDSDEEDSDEEDIDDEEDSDEEEESEEEEDSEEEIDDEFNLGGEGQEEKKKSSNIPRKSSNTLERILDEEENEEYEDENYFQKFNSEVNKNYILDQHPECCTHNYEEILNMTKVWRDEKNNVVDPLHKTIPFMTKYEKTRIIGIRAKQINSGSTPFINIDKNVIDGYLIAEMELREKKIPFIIRRPLPNGSSEYWNIKDLELH
jgi:DNA-directed RNA polymerase subunit K/omega